MVQVGRHSDDFVQAIKGDRILCYDVICAGGNYWKLLSGNVLLGGELGGELLKTIHASLVDALPTVCRVFSRPSVLYEKIILFLREPLSTANFSENK